MQHEHKTGCRLFFVLCWFRFGLFLFWFILVLVLVLCWFWFCFRFCFWLCFWFCLFRLLCISCFGIFCVCLCRVRHEHIKKRFVWSSFGFDFILFWFGLLWFLLCWFLLCWFFVIEYWFIVLWFAFLLLFFSVEKLVMLVLVTSHWSEKILYGLKPFNRVLLLNIDLMFCGLLFFCCFIFRWKTRHVGFGDFSLIREDSIWFETVQQVFYQLFSTDNTDTQF